MSSKSEVIDNGVGTAAAARVDNGRQRHGLIGMRERVALHRGQFEAGPRAEGGFGVRASFPLAEHPRERPHVTRSSPLFGAESHSVRGLKLPFGSE